MDLDALVDPLVKFAGQMLRQRGEFYPFAVVMNTDGGIEMVGGQPGDEHPPSSVVIDLLVAGLRAGAETGRIRASGLCFDSLWTGPDGKKTDAIAMSLEHRAGDGAMVFKPCSKGRLGGWKFGQLVASAPTERRVFASRP